MTIASTRLEGILQQMRNENPWDAVDVAPPPYDRRPQRVSAAAKNDLGAVLAFAALTIFTCSACGESSGRGPGATSNPARTGDASAALGGANDSGAWGSSAAHAEHDADPAHDENGTLDLPLAPGTEAESSSVDGGASNGTNGQVRRESDDIDLTLDLGSRGPDASSEEPSMQATDTSDLTSGPSSDDDASASDITSNGASSVDTGSSSDDESAVTTETTSDHQTSVGTELTSEDQSSSADTSSADTSSADTSSADTSSADTSSADTSWSDVTIVFECMPGDQRACEGRQGACARGVETCQSEGSWGTCSITAAESDACVEGDDSNCNGIPNEGCECIAGQTSTCARQFASQGVCGNREVVCTSDGQWSNPCAATSVEVCDTNQLDEDCDGLVNEPDVCNTPPRVTITLPSQDLGATNDTAYDGMDSELGLWYVDIRVAATALDPEDGDLSGTNLRWYTNRSDIHPEAFLGTGATTTVRLYSNDCFGVIHELRVEATDSFGATTVSSPRQITIWTLC